MGVYTQEYYNIRCDEPGCPETTGQGDFSAWSDLMGAEEDWYASGGDMRDGKYFCEQHLGAEG